MKKITKLIKKIRNPKFLRIVLGVVLALIIIVVYVILEKKINRVQIDNAQIEAPIVNIAPLTPGKLMEIDTTEDRLIKKGDPLAVVGSDTIRADADGLIIMVNRQIGGLMSAQTPVVQMIDPANFRIVGTIDENKGLNKIKLGQTVSFTIDALSGKTFWGYIDEVSPTAKQTQLTFSISSERPTQQFEVYARFNAYAYPEIKNGMSAKMTVYTKMP